MAQKTLSITVLGMLSTEETQTTILAGESGESKKWLVHVGPFKRYFKLYHLIAV